MDPLLGFKGHQDCDGKDDQEGPEALVGAPEDFGSWVFIPSQPISFVMPLGLHEFL